jgi:hypothetical protein
MPEYRVRYIVGEDERTGRPIYHSVTVSAEEPPDEDQALQVAFLQESHLYEDSETRPDEIEVEDIRELAPIPFLIRTRARFVQDPYTGDWMGPLFEGPVHTG